MSISTDEQPGEEIRMTHRAEFGQVRKAVGFFRSDAASPDSFQDHRFQLPCNAIRVTLPQRHESLGCGDGAEYVLVEEGGDAAVRFNSEGYCTVAKCN